VVDDNEVNRLILERILASWGWQVTAAPSGPEALAQLRNAADTGSAFDLVLLDGQMPQMDGFEVAERVRDDRLLRETVILMITSDLRENGVERASDLQISHYLMKPVARSALFNTIQSLLLEKGTASGRPKATAAPGEAPTVRNLRVLLAEDDLANQQVVGRLLQMLEHRVDIVANGREALESMARVAYDLVLMDVNMPEMDGYEATRAIRERERASGAHTPIIALTALAFAEDRNRCIESGMDNYVAKPVRLQALDRVIRETVGASALAAAPERQASRRENDRAFDRELALELIGGDGSLLNRVGEIILENAPAYLEEIRAAHENGDAERLAAGAHRLKGMVSNLGENAAFHAGQSLERHARRGELDAAANALVQLEREMERLLDTLQEMTEEA
jgi:CheY-like chemotaxis protein